jgi:hypothetical protein
MISKAFSHSCPDPLNKKKNNQSSIPILAGVVAVAGFSSGVGCAPHLSTHTHERPPPTALLGSGEQ